MKICPTCAKEYDDEHRFCGNCGAELIKHPVFCIKCGEKLEPCQQFCGNCGKKVQAIIDKRITNGVPCNQPAANEQTCAMPSEKNKSWPVDEPVRTCSVGEDATCTALLKENVNSLHNNYCENGRTTLRVIPHSKMREKYPFFTWSLSFLCFPIAIFILSKFLPSFSLGSSYLTINKISHVLLTCFGLCYFAVVLSYVINRIEKEINPLISTSLENGFLNKTGKIGFVCFAIGTSLILIIGSYGAFTIIIGIVVFLRLKKIIEIASCPGFGLGILMYIGWIAVGIVVLAVKLAEFPSSIDTFSLLFLSFLFIILWIASTIRLGKTNKYMRLAAPGIIFAVTAGIGVFFINFNMDTEASIASATTPGVTGTTGLDSIGADNVPLAGSTAIADNIQPELTNMTSTIAPNAANTASGPPVMDAAPIPVFSNTTPDFSTPTSPVSVDIQNNSGNTVLHIDMNNNHGTMYDSNQTFAGNITTDTAGTTAITDNSGQVSYVETGDIIVGSDGHIDGIEQINIDGSSSIIDPHTRESIDIKQDGTISKEGVTQGKIIKND